MAESDRIVKRGIRSPSSSHAHATMLLVSHRPNMQTGRLCHNLELEANQPVKVTPLRTLARVLVLATLLSAGPDATLAASDLIRPEDERPTEVPRPVKDSEPDKLLNETGADGPEEVAREDAGGGAKGDAGTTADPAQRPRTSQLRHWDLDLTLGTDFPLDYGVRLTLEGPFRITVNGTLGYMPERYIQTINRILIAADVYSAEDGDLVVQVLKDSLVARVHLGWRPVSRWGLYGEAGYTVLTLGGDVSSEVLIQAATGMAPPLAGTVEHNYMVEATTHLWDLEVGWLWRLLRKDRLTLRAALGFTRAFQADSTVTPLYDPFLPEEVAAFTTDTEAYINTTLESYVISPLITIQAGFRFF